MGLTPVAVTSQAHRLGVLTPKHRRAMFAVANPGLRICAACQQTKADDAFYFHPKYGRPQGHCKECIAAAKYADVFAVLARCRGVRAGGLALEVVHQKWTAQAGRCFYSGEPMTHDGTERMVSVDRLDSAGPYSPENTVLCCYAINMMKRTLSVQAFKEWCGKVAAHDVSNR